MRNTLVLFTALSRSLLSLAYDALDSGPTICVDTDDGIHAQLKQAGISSIALRVPNQRTWAERDTAFRELAMPGKLTGNFPDTNLPAWKVLSLDRLNFWYRAQADAEYQAVTALDFDRVIAPLSLHHPLPWRLAREYKVMAVQTESLRTRAWLDWLSRPLPFDKLFVWSERDKALLAPYFQGQIYVTNAGDGFSATPATGSERKAVRKGLEIPDNAKVGLVLFDSQMEWEFRSALADLLKTYTHLLIYPLRDYDRRNLSDYGIVTGGPLRVIDNLSVEPAADEAIVFRYDEALMARRIPTRVFDLGRWESEALSG